MKNKLTLVELNKRLECLEDCTLKEIADIKHKVSVFAGQVARMQSKFDKLKAPLWVQIKNLFIMKK